MGVIVGQLDSEFRAFIEVELLKEGAEPVKLKALLDTGATHSHAPPAILEERGAEFIHSIKVDVHGSSGDDALDAGLYWVDVRFPAGDDGAPGFRMDMPTINTEASAAPMIIGMDALRHFDLTYKRTGQFFLEW